MTCKLTFSFLFLNVDRQIPTVLSYVDGEEYYGQQAKNFLVRNPKNTVAYFKDLLGREYVVFFFFWRFSCFFSVFCVFCVLIFCVLIIRPWTNG